MKLPSGPCWGRLVGLRKATRKRPAKVLVDLCGVLQEFDPEQIEQLAGQTDLPPREG